MYFDKFLKLVNSKTAPEQSECSMKTSGLPLIMKISQQRFLNMVDFFFDNWDSMKLIICCSKGSSYENIFDKVIELAENETLCRLKYDGIKTVSRIRFFIHVMISSHFENLKEIFYHNLTKKEAVEYVLDFNIYHCAGWKQYWIEKLNSSTS